LILAFAFAVTGSAPAEPSDVRTGRVHGYVTDTETKSPLAAANVLTEDTQMGGFTDGRGRFAIGRVPVGSYTLLFRYVGYEPARTTDVIVKSGRITSVHAELKAAIIQVLSYGGTLPWAYRDTPYEKVVDPESVMTESVHCIGPTASGIVVKLTRTTAAE
jgi:hypothetical protein